MSWYGGSVILDLIKELQEEEDRSLHFTFDNLFTSLKLVDRCSKKKQTNKQTIAFTETICVFTETIPANGIGDCPLKSVKEMEKSKRGNLDYATDVKSGLTVVHWHDNNIIMQHTFKQGRVAPPQIAKRWSRAEAKRMEITQPFMVKHYNQTMGGFAQMDHNLDKYRISMCSKK